MTVPMNRSELWAAAIAERHRVRATLLRLPPAAWDEPSLCAGWTVRDVAVHLARQAQQSTPGFLTGMLRARFDIDRYNAVQLRGAAAWSPARIAAALDHDRALLFFRVNPAALLVENVVHHLDIAVPLGLQPDIPPAYLQAVAAALPDVTPPPAVTVADVLRAAGRRPTSRAEPPPR